MLSLAAIRSSGRSHITLMMLAAVYCWMALWSTFGHTEEPLSDHPQGHPIAWFTSEDDDPCYACEWERCTTAEVEVEGVVSLVTDYMGDTPLLYEFHPASTQFSSQIPRAPPA